MSQVGIGIVTCNRLDYLKNLLKSITNCNWADLIIVNDGDRFELEDHDYYIHHNEENLGVGKSKNIAMKHLLDRGCDYIFIIEDDMVILDDAVFDEYIEASKISGIQHFNYGPGSPFNRKQSIQNFDLHNRDQLLESSQPVPLISIDYNQLKVDLYQHCAGVFSFFTKRILSQVGLHDESFYNAWEHVDHTYRIILANAHPPFWWFADIHNSVKYLDTQHDAIKNSSTSNNKEEWFENIRRGREIYKQKHGFYPNMTPNYTKQEVVSCLKKISRQWTT
jgi:GT2 family glycosyltransferase